MNRTENINNGRYYRTLNISDTMTTNLCNYMKHPRWQEEVN